MVPLLYTRHFYLNLVYNIRQISTSNKYFILQSYHKYIKHLTLTIIYLYSNDRILSQVGIVSACQVATRCLACS